MKQRGKEKAKSILGGNPFINLALDQLK